MKKLSVTIQLNQTLTSNDGIGSATEEFRDDMLTSRFHRVNLYHSVN